jgi:plasmid stabilization system protein ParE
MTTWALSADAADDLDRLVDFLLEASPESVATTVDLILDALVVLVLHPKIGRLIEHSLRELVISRGKSGYLALYDYDELADMVLVLAVRHQREQGYH